MLKSVVEAHGSGPWQTLLRGSVTIPSIMLAVINLICSDIVGDMLLTKSPIIKGPTQRCT